MNIYDIAKKAGVSVATVSRVLNDSPKVSERSKQKVKAVMDAEGYVPNIFARGLTLNTVRTVGIICPVISDINHAEAVSHLESLLRKNGFDTLLTCSGGYDTDKAGCLDLLMAKRVDAIVCIGSTMKEFREKSCFAVAAGQVPVVIVNGLVKCDNVYSVLCDEETAAFECVRNLHERGFDDIVYMYDTDTYSGHQKLQGFRRGADGCGIGEDRHVEIKIDTDPNGIDSAFSATSKLLESGRKIAALIAADDIIAVGAQKALTHYGLKVPIVGFNNSRFAQCADPEISSVDIMVESLCGTAISLLMDVLKGKPAPDRVLLSAKFVERESFRLG